MPITPNYGWTTPIVSGDFGAWGGILNTAFTEIDTDLKALADLVTANALNVAKTNVNNSFSGTQNFAALSASGNITASGTVTGTNVASLNVAAANGVRTTVSRFAGGADGTLGELYLQMFVTPSATAGSRIAEIWSGDNGALRKLGLLSSQCYIGPTTPSFAGAEILRVQGAMYVDNAITASSFNGPVSGSGAGITSNTIPQAAVVSLVSDLAAKSAVGHTHVQSDITGLVAALAGKSDVGHTHVQSDITGLVAALAGKSDTSHTHDGSAITSGTIAWARIDQSGANPTGASIGSPGRPNNGLLAGSWTTWISIGGDKYIPVYQTTAL